MSKKKKKLKKASTPLTADEISELYALESEPASLKKEYNIEDKTWFAKAGDWYYAFKEAHASLNPVNRKTYLWLCLFCGVRRQSVLCEALGERTVLSGSELDWHPCCHGAA
ncbi:MAG: hypothetical protein IJ252_06680 [Solobacterium sp.]|nr:hypothetical protein [Solobacterium sp.]